jgi:hypothetical protein
MQFFFVPAGFPLQSTTSPLARDKKFHLLNLLLLAKILGENGNTFEMKNIGFTLVQMKY